MNSEQIPLVSSRRQARKSWIDEPLDGPANEISSSSVVFFSEQDRQMLAGSTHSGTAALAGCRNSRQSGRGAQQIQLWLLPILQVVSLRLSWRWAAESCQRHPGGKSHWKGLLSALQRCAHVPQRTELPCPCIINNFLLLALSKDSFCCTGDFLSCVLWMGDIKYGANILTLGEVMPGGNMYLTRQPPIRAGKAPDICSRCFLQSKDASSDWPACTRAAGTGLGCSGESTVTVPYWISLPVSIASRNEMIVTG